VARCGKQNWITNNLLKMPWGSGHKYTAVEMIFLIAQFLPPYEKLIER
jgi:hypothetical protein